MFYAFFGGSNEAKSNDEAKKFAAVKNDADHDRLVAEYRARKAKELRDVLAQRDILQNRLAEAKQFALEQPEIAEKSAHIKDSRARLFHGHQHAELTKIREKMQKAQEKWPTKGILPCLK